MRTVNRIPKQVTITDVTEDYFNMISFEGIKNSENDLKVSPSSFIDANNVYINSNNVLSSRPTLKASNFETITQDLIYLEDIKKVWVVDDVLVYHTGETLRFVKKGILSEIIILNVGDVIDVLESIENYIIIYPANKYVDMTSKNEDGVNTFVSGSMCDLAYIPTTELRAGNQISYPEKHNMITPKYKTSIIYDKEIYNDLSEYNGEDVEVMIDSKTHKVQEFDSRLDVLSFQKLLTVADFEYIKYSTLGSAIGYKDYMFYYAADGANFVALPVVPSGIVSRSNPLDPQHPTLVKNVGEGFITEAGDAIFVIGMDHLYGLSLLDTKWNSESDTVSKRWEDWTRLEWGSATTIQSSITGDVTTITPEDLAIRLNLINITNPMNVHPTTYSKNYGRFINDTTFMLSVYAGNVNDASIGGNASGKVRPTIFLYNHQTTASKVEIYQIATPDKMISQNLANEICASDLALFGNKMIISMAYRYQTNGNVSTDLSSFTIDVNANGEYTLVTKVKNDTLLSIGLGSNPYLSNGDIKLSYSSYNAGMSSGTINQLVYDMTIMYNSTNNIKLNKYILTEVISTTPADNQLNSHALNLEFDEAIQSPIIMMSRSTNKALLYSGILLANTDNVILYNYIPYLLSEYMKPIYIDEDTIITTIIHPVIVGNVITKYDESNEFYTTDNVVATVSHIKQRDDFEVMNVKLSAKLSNLYFVEGRNLYIGDYKYDEEENMTLYFPTNLWEEFEETIFQLQIISKDTLGVYCRDNLWIIYRDEQGLFRKIKTKIANSCREGDQVSLSLNGEGSLFPCHRGIAYISHQSLLSVEEQKLSFISDDVQNYIVEWLKNKAVGIFTYEYWMYIYSKDSNEIWLMDLRNSTWWKWSVPTNVDNIVVYLNNVYILTNNRLCVFTFDGVYKDAIDYNDDWKLTSIPWFIESQRLYLKDINRYKHIYAMIINSRVDDEEREEKSMRLETIIYRSEISKDNQVYRTSRSQTAEEVLSYKVVGHRTFVKRLRIFKCNLFKFRLSSDTDTPTEEGTVDPSAIKIESIAIKYGVKERVR